MQPTADYQCSSDLICNAFSISHEAGWFVVHAKARREKFAASKVQGLGTEVFFPELAVPARESRIIKGGSRPLFPGYFFARFCPQDFLGAVECCPGVIHVIKSGRVPIPVEDEIIREIQDRIDGDGLIHVAHQQLRIGDRVSIQNGPLEGLLGRVVGEVDDQARVAVLLEAMWQARVVIERGWLMEMAV
jgi:transcription antitermination factor NusG